MMFETYSISDLLYRIDLPWYEYGYIGCSYLPKFFWIPRKSVTRYKNLIFNFKVDCLTEVMKRSNLTLNEVDKNLIRNLTC